MHTLINPKIRSWNMDTVASDKKDLMEHNVTLEYEGIYFGKGRVTRFNPDGWTDLHYDLDPSPIGGLFGRTDGTLFGPFGLVADGTTLFQDLQGIDNGQPVDQRTALAILLKSARLIGNASNLNTSLAQQEVLNATLNSAGFGITDTATGSVVGLVIPSNNINNTTTVAQPRTVTQTTATPTTTTTTTTTYSDPYTTPDGKPVKVNNADVDNALNQFLSSSPFNRQAYNNLSENDQITLYNKANSAISNPVVPYSVYGSAEQIAAAKTGYANKVFLEKLQAAAINLAAYGT
jgi:hypothetical protein